MSSQEEFNWEDYLKLAEYTLNNKNSIGLIEACNRNSVSRAYYAAYAFSYALLKKKSTVNTFTFRTSRGRYYTAYIDRLKHHEVIQWFYMNSNNDPDFLMIHSYLKIMFDTRVKADYLSEADVTHKDAVDTIQYAKEVIELIKTK